MRNQTRGSPRVFQRGGRETGPPPNITGSIASTAGPGSKAENANLSARRADFIIHAASRNDNIFNRRSLMYKKKTVAKKKHRKNLQRLKAKRQALLAKKKSA